MNAYLQYITAWNTYWFSDLKKCDIQIGCVHFSFKNEFVLQFLHGKFI